MKEETIKSFNYDGHFIELNYNGLYSCFIEGKGYIKADSLAGIKRLIGNTI